MSKKAALAKQFFVALALLAGATRAADTKSGAEKLVTAEDAGMRAMQSSYAARAADASLKAAAARVDQAWSSFLPRLTASYSYTRLSPMTAPTLLPAGVTIATTDPVGTVNPNTVVVPTPAFSFPILLDNHALVGQIVVPISDYFFRISQSYTAASQAQEAARHDARAARAKAYADGVMTYYSWLRARGAVTVAEQALKDQQQHLKDAKQLFTAGMASKADMLRAETGVASAELQVERTRNLATLTEAQLRLALHEPATVSLRPADEISAPGVLPTTDLPTAVAHAEKARPELLALDANVRALRKQAQAARGVYYPQIAGVGNITYASPNQRRIPQTNEWFPTWAVGVQASWSPNDIFTGAADGSNAAARADALANQAETAKQGIELEVTQAHQSVGEARVALDASARQIAAAEEAYRVAHELYINGRATSTLLTDAETDLTRARLDRLNSLVDSHVARVRLEHATGEDAAKLKL